VQERALSPPFPASTYARQGGAIDKFHPLCNVPEEAQVTRKHHTPKSKGGNSRLEEEEEEEEEGRLFVFNHTIEGPRVLAVKPGRIT
jgi:hypothetical protein